MNAMSAIDDYLASVNPAQRAELERIRTVIARAAPEAEEGRSYGMPAFRYAGRPLIGFTASKKHLSIHPFSPDVVDAVRDKLASFDLSKGTIRFTTEQPLPDSVLREIVELRLKELT
jgi:uncharacterized protein YdhG (YjbR/CyaY superfamily)